TNIKLEQFKERQKEVFLKQIDLACELNLPVIVHCRSAHNDLIGLLNKYGKASRGVVHCFTGNWQEAQQYLEMGFHLGFNGIIFKLELTEVIEKTPFDRILLETDCPYLTPPQESGRNEPLFVKHVAERIAQIKKLSYEEISEKTTKNAKELFNI
ncbi:MAG: TatD family hydrolase, partial [bacterium]|nr:TatD family hydrolase [bacterium]